MCAMGFGVGRRNEAEEQVQQGWGGAGGFTTGIYYSNSSFLSFLVPVFALLLLGVQYYS